MKKISKKEASMLKIKAEGKSHLLAILKYRHTKTKNKKEKTEESLEKIIKNSFVDWND
jgi:hypothetical protein